MIDGFKRLMLPMDFSEHSDRAAEYAEWVARVSKAAVHLVHVIVNPADALYEPKEEPHLAMVAHAQKQALARLQAAAHACVPPPCVPQFHVAVGDPYEQLIEVARNIRPDLIVMSTHGRGGVAHLVIGSVAEKMVRHAPCPVFVVRRRAD